MQLARPGLVSLSAHHLFTIKRALVMEDPCDPDRGAHSSGQEAGVQRRPWAGRWPVMGPRPWCPGPAGGGRGQQGECH